MTDEDAGHCIVCGKQLTKENLWTKKATGDKYHRNCYLKIENR